MKQSTAIALLGAAAAAVVVVVGVIFFWPGAPGQQAQQGPPPLPADARMFDSWALTCGNDAEGVKRCALLMRVLERETRRMMLSINLTRGPRGNPILVTMTPPSVVNTSGLTITPEGGKAVTGQFQRCTPQSCTSIIVLTEDLAKEIAASEMMTVQYVAGNGNPVRYPLPSKGFAAGYAAWEADFPRPAAATPAPTSPAPAAPAAAPARAPAAPAAAPAAPAAPAPATP